MKRAPFRVLFFLAALVALGLYAGAVTIPNLFRAGEPIVAEEVNENLATLASGLDALDVELATLTDVVEAGLGPREVVVAAPPLDVEEVGLPTTVVTTADGRWSVNVGFEGVHAMWDRASRVGRGREGRFRVTVHRGSAEVIE